jgi:hypothetical protein
MMVEIFLVMGVPEIPRLQAHRKATMVATLVFLLGEREVDQPHQVLELLTLSAALLLLTRLAVRKAEALPFPEALAALLVQQIQVMVVTAAFTLGVTPD